MAGFDGKVWGLGFMFHGLGFTIKCGRRVLEFILFGWVVRV